MVKLFERAPMMLSLIKCANTQRPNIDIHKAAERSES